VLKVRGATVDVNLLVDTARDFIRAEPRSFAEITTLLTGLMPEGDPGGMRYAVRTHLPMIQVPIQKAWSYPGNPRFALADDWLGKPVPEHEHLPNLSIEYRSRVMPKAYRSKVYLPGLRVAATVLIDGFVAGVWTTERVKREATLLIEPFDALTPRAREELIEEGERLVRFVEPEAQSFSVRLTG
jgi:hypothetical protein